MAIYALRDAVPDIAPSVFVHPDATVIGNVTIGEGSTVWPQAVLRGDYGKIVIGARTNIQDGAVIHCTRELDTFIGDHCVVGHLAHLECCVVEDGALVGTGAIVLHRAVVRSGARASCRTGWTCRPVPSRSAFRRGFARAPPTPPTSRATPPSTRATAGV